MLQKQKPMTERLPALVVPDEMMAQLTEIAKKEDLTMSELVRQGLTFFLAHYFSQTKVRNSTTQEKAS